MTKLNEGTRKCDLLCFDYAIEVSRSAAYNLGHSRRQKQLACVVITQLIPAGGPFYGKGRAFMAMTECWTILQSLLAAVVDTDQPGR